ncbi:MAG TPA: complex I NDUFA9 subunit family protein [Burkholderiales bacterium]|nr:complex I NDUFA9 subunit family protein [Burkholderiales bacterium]
MIINDVLVLGGSGFVGRHVCHQLVARGYRVTVPTRNRERAKEDLIPLPTAEVVDADVHDPQTLAALTRNCDAVVNLVGVLHDGRGQASFREAHVELTRRVVEACRARGIRRLLHMSALNADPRGPSAYLRSKGEAETVVCESGLDFTIFRPSVIFGREDRFLNLFAQLQRLLPVVFLAMPNARFQPVFVQDVAAVFAESLKRLESFGRAYELAGPRVYTLRELVQYVGELTGHRRLIIGLGPRSSRLQALAMEFLPGKLMTRDNVDSMKLDSVSAEPLPFGVSATALEAVAPTWLAQRTPRGRYQQFRERTHGGR